MGKPRHLADDIRKLRDSGKTYDEIRDILGCAKSTISYHVGKGNENTRAKGQFSRKAIKNFIKLYKTANPCSDCGKRYRYYAMQFDHLPEHEKLFSIAKFFDYTHDLSVVMEEMRKCQLVCANCHTERTHQRRKEEAVALAPKIE